MLDLIRQGGFKRGETVLFWHTGGATDELGYAAVEDPVHVNDFHATMLHLFGIDHTKLTYRALGRDFRLTDVAGKIVPQLIA